MAESKINPSTGIIEMEEENPLKKRVSEQIERQQEQNKFKELDEERLNEIERRERRVSRRENKPEKKEEAKITATFAKLSVAKRAEEKNVPKLKAAAKETPLQRSAFGRFFRVRSRKNLKDQLKILKFRTDLENQRLKNEIQKFKLQRKLESMRKSGKFMLMPAPIVRISQPYHQDPIIDADIASSFNADMGHGDSLFGNEDYFGGENFYPEDIWGEEFYKDQFAELGIPIKNKGGNPLFW